MKEWLDCCMDACSSYIYGSDIGLERLSYQSKIISINIRISPLLSRENVKHARFLKSNFKAQIEYENIDFTADNVKQYNAVREKP